MSKDALWAGYDTGKCQCPDGTLTVPDAKGNCNCTGGITAIAPVREPMTHTLTGDRASAANAASADSAWSFLESPLFLIGAVAAGLWVLSSFGEPEKGSKK